METAAETNGRGLHGASPRATWAHDLPAPETAPKGRKRFVALGAAAMVVVLGLGAWSLATRGKEETDDAQVEADVVPIGARVGGQVLRVAVQENQHVRRGDLLFQLDDADSSARVKQADAELETARAQADAAEALALVSAAGARGGFSSARAGVSSSSAAVATARASLAAAEALAHKAALDLSRARELRRANVAPQAQLDAASSSNDAAQAGLQQARANLLAAESRIGEAQGKLAQSSPVDQTIAAGQAQARLARARVQSAQAALELARLQLSYTRISAQVDGTVTRLAVHEGALVTPGQTLAALVPDQIYVVANFKETQIGAMRSGQPVDVRVDAFGKTELKGRVESLSAGTGARFSLLPPDNASGNFVKVVQRIPVRIALLETPGNVALRAGLSADVTVHTR